MLFDKINTILWDRYMIHEVDEGKSEAPCHLGIFDNSNKNFLSSNGVGENPVYIKLGKGFNTNQSSFREADTGIDL